jgi:hypothetical protein
VLRLSSSLAAKCSLQLPDAYNHYTLHAHELHFGSLSRKPPHLRKPDDRAPVLRFGAGHWKLILRKPDDRAPAYTSTLPKALDAINLPGKA